MTITAKYLQTLTVICNIILFYVISSDSPSLVVNVETKQNI